MLGKFILWLSTIAFVSYGIQCLLDPTTLEGFAGLTFSNGDGYAELGAMYGGLQTGFGIFLLMGALRSDMFRPALTSLVVVIGSLALGRLYSTLGAPEPVGMYTWGAMGYEFFTAIVAGIALQAAKD
jgi:Domain of unknown function (DUF4345)